MLDSLHRSVSNPVSASCQQYLRIDCTLWDLPDFLTDTFYIITNGADNVELGNYLLRERAITQEDIIEAGAFQVPEEYRRSVSTIDQPHFSQQGSQRVLSNDCYCNYWLV